MIRESRLYYLKRDFQLNLVFQNSSHKERNKNSSISTFYTKFQELQVSTDLKGNPVYKAKWKEHLQRKCKKILLYPKGW